MAIKVVLPTDVDTVSIGGLHQWDYGQVLEIESPEISTEIMEIHFACANMTEAIVRVCSFVDGVGTVTIPDQCLEQASTITAWIYRIVDNAGYTIKTISLKIAARIRPGVLRELPQTYSDKYDELIVEVNGAISDLENGNTKIGYAKRAENADMATNAKVAESASNAGYAESAGHAKTADRATVANMTHADTAANATNAVTAEHAKTAGQAAGANKADVLRVSDERTISTTGCYILVWGGNYYSEGITATIICIYNLDSYAYGSDSRVYYYDPNYKSIVADPTGGAEGTTLYGVYKICDIT